MAVTVSSPSGTVSVVRFALLDYAEEGLLKGRGAGERARHDLERLISDLSTRDPHFVIALDFDQVRSVSVPFAEGFLVPLLSNRLTGYYEEHPILVLAADEDVSETLAAALARRQLSVLGLISERPDLLGGERGLRETIRAAFALGHFSVGDLSRQLGVSGQTANERLRALHRLGAVARRQLTPKGGGREFVYWVPTGVGSDDDAAQEPQAQHRPIAALPSA